MELLGFTVENQDKWTRAVDGTVASNGLLSGGVGEKASDLAKLAEYDRLGGLVKKGGRIVKTGSFYDFAKKKPRTKPEVVYVYWVEKKGRSKKIEVPEGEVLPLEVEASELSKKADDEPEE